MFNYELVKLHFTHLDLKYLPLEEDSELDDSATKVQHRNSKSRFVAGQL